MVRDRKHDVYLEAILADMQSDAPRSAYADWLTRRGDPRGEFIRVQCVLDKMEAADPSRGDLETREAELLAEFKEEWLFDLPLLDRLLAWCEFHRGFPVATLDLGEFDHNVFRYGPSGEDYSEDADEASFEYFLDVSQRFNIFVQRMNPATMFIMARDENRFAERGAYFVEWLGDSRHFLFVTGLDLHGGSLSNAAVSAIARAGFLRVTYRFLDLDTSTEFGNEPNDDAVRVLANSPRMQTLRSLNLDGWLITDEGSELLVHSPYLNRLESLIIGRLTDELTFVGMDALRRRFGKALNIL